MRNMQRMIGLAWLGIWIVLMAGYWPAEAGAAARPEIRALWVDAFHDGAKSPAQIDRLIQDAVQANINTLIVQVRRRGDAYYHYSIEPRTEDPELMPGFDALQYLIRKAHARQLEVHAWLNTLVAWNSPTPPRDPNHVWNLHGPKAAGDADWVSYYRTYNAADRSWSDQLTPSYYLDPGNPAAVDYTAAVYLNVVKNYDVDGIHLDYTRYAGLGWGYNPTSVNRYNAWRGTSGLPAPDDPQWQQWRREQTAALIRKVYLQAIALKPRLKVSSAVIAWGDGPGDWQKSRAYSEVSQDWRGWLEEGIIDLVMPMNYFREWGTQQLWYNKWIEWQKDCPYGRRIVIGPGIYMQYIEDTLAQIRRAQAPSARGNYAAGVVLYAYGSTNVYSNDDYRNPAAAGSLPRQPYQYLPQSNDWLFRLLSAKGGYWEPVQQRFVATEPVFAAPAAVPDLPWKSHPTRGFLMGVVTGPDGARPDRWRVTVESRARWGRAPEISRTVSTDGSGWYGLAELPPGRYRVTVEPAGAGKTVVRQVLIQAGRVAQADLTIDGAP
jgi:uncharacterized lipoprotein YddW (UPF0748 family)